MSGTKKPSLHSAGRWRFRDRFCSLARTSSSSRIRHLTAISSRSSTRTRITSTASSSAIPDYRLKPSDKPIITFEERAAGSPEAVKAWFYPGENYGHDFVYPKAKAVELAKANKQPVASMPTELAANTTKPTTTMQEPHVMAMKQAPLKAQKPAGEEVEIGEVFPPTRRRRRHWRRPRCRRNCPRPPVHCR